MQNMNEIETEDGSMRHIPLDDKAARFHYTQLENTVG
jgi:hypothetical protein